ncbi:HNH endonuclease [Sphingobium sp. ZW T5_29]|uniref:HNH endonuclease n=1 Tax=Sphingobium sp. ZW T5_29 TaxID=3378077 RepID=UPI003851BD22
MLQNETCPYCGTQLTRQNRTKEHVIGRRFVPRGSLHQHWNLIVWACEPCNSRKAALEDDISAISMHPDVSGAHARDDVRLHTEAARKALNSISRRSGKPVANSQENLTITMRPFAGVELKFNLTSSPQVDEARIIELARMQVMAFFYWITIQDGEINGRFWRGSFMPLPPVRRADWGNAQLRFFMTETGNWDGRVHAVTADGYFRLAIKKHPSELLWSFAVEWNESYRIVGFFGDEDELGRISARVPALHLETIHGQGTDRVRYRREVPLPTEEDDLFDPPWEDEADSAA